MQDGKAMLKKSFLTSLYMLCAVCAASAQGMLEGDTLQEVVVTATGTRHQLRNAPVQTEVITGKMLQSYAGRSVEDILSGLTSSFAFSEDDMGSHIQMGGLGNSYILILIDGKRIHGDVGGENDLSLVDPHNIERIEIVKGASSALYGSDAIAGVINIITRKPQQKGIMVENATRYGSYNDLRQHNALAFTLGRLSSHTTFQLQYSDGWQNTKVENTTPTEQPILDSKSKTVNRHTNWQVAERLSYDFTPALSVYAEGSTYWKRIYRPQDGHYGRFDVYYYDLHYRNQSAAAGGEWKLGKQDRLSMDVTWARHAYYYIYTADAVEEDYEKSKGTLYYPYFPYLEGQKSLQSDQQRTLATLKGVFALPAGNLLSAGMEYRYDWLHAPSRVKGGKVSDRTAAVYAQDEWKCQLGENVYTHLTAGLRFTHNRQSGNRLTPKVSAMFRLGTPWRVRAQWSQGFKTPTPKELFYRYVRQMSGTYLYLGNTQLRPQTSNYFSLNGEYSHAGLSVAVTGYYNRVNDMIALVTIPNYQAPAEYIAQYDPMRTRQYQNIEDAKTYGVDVNVRYDLKEFAFGLGYSYLNTEANQYDTTHDRLRSVVIDGMAHHRGNLFATWNHAFAPAYRFGLGIYGRMSSERFYQTDGNGRGYQTWRLNTSHDFGSQQRTACRVEVGVDNIFNYVDRTPHGLHLGTTTPGTTVYASLTVRFAHGKKPKPNQTYKFQSKTNNHEEN